MAEKHVTILPNGDLFVSGVGCSLECKFCVEGGAKRVSREVRSGSRLTGFGEAMGLPRPVVGALRALGRRVLGARETLPSVPPGEGEVFRELDDALPRISSDEIVLAAHDILELEGLFEALDLCARHGKKVALISPGLRLSDPDFARRLAPRIARFTITFLSDDPVTYQRLTGRSDAHERVRAAIRNLVSLKVPLDVNCVVTSLNVQDLQGVASFLLDEMSLESFTLVGFLLEKRHLELDPGAPDLIAPYSALNGELQRIGVRYRVGLKRLVLLGIPPCRLSEDVLDSRCIRFGTLGPDDGLAMRHWDASCAGCEVRHACPGVFAAHHWRHPREQSDPVVVSRLAPWILERWDEG